MAKWREAQQASSEAERRHHLIPGTPVAIWAFRQLLLSCSVHAKARARVTAGITPTPRLLCCSLEDKIQQLVGVAVDRNIKQPTWHVAVDRNPKH